MALGGPSLGNHSGTNLAMIVNSCGIRPNYIDADTTFMFAGVHSIMFTMPTNAVQREDLIGGVYSSDTAQNQARGSLFSSYLLANQLGSIASAWLQPTLNSATYGGIGFYSTGNAELDPISPYTDPTNQALGCQTIVSRAQSGSLAYWHAHSEGLVGAASESNDPTTNTYYSWNAQCNYSVDTYGLQDGTM